MTNMRISVPSIRTQFLCSGAVLILFLGVAWLIGLGAGFWVGGAAIVAFSLLNQLCSIVEAQWSLYFLKSFGYLAVLLLIYLSALWQGFGADRPALIYALISLIIIHLLLIIPALLLRQQLIQRGRR